MSSMTFKQRLAEGKNLHWTTPGFGWCYRCFMPWKYTKGHTTMYGEGIGCFPLCVDCWPELTPEERLPFYRQLYEHWLGVNGADTLPSEKREDYIRELLTRWPLIEAAVLKGL